MKGRILHIDHATGVGVITGADGHRYDVAAADLLGDGQIARPGVSVDFEVDGNRAVRVYPNPVQAFPGILLDHKNRLVAGLLALFLGAFGFHKFYLGYNTAGLIMLVSTLFGFVLLWIPTGIVAVIALIEAVIYLTRTDEQFYETYEAGQKAWF
ncbi:TM2 domain-containing protein [Paracoccus suum]|uniref:TM2 domain-containing protein n=1 Tax=Paracoccus suum TaxID=2259340 RepID=A0A344PND5_9RHOB|nr:TM2 domain-containing protein [Paracoccus suum]AXC50890.1 TM2 domain-containing protein [Paracoccus suum]